MQELVSILIPSYNAEHWIRETIESALSQTWHNKEIIIVDDGSTDRTLQIAKQYDSKLVKVISQENRGANAARNKALEFAQGDYLQWLDADDLLAPEKIEKQMLESVTIANPRILLTSSWVKFYYRYENEKFTPDNLWRDLDPIDWLITKFSENVWMNPAAWLVSRQLTESVGAWDERLNRDQDGEYICRIVSKSEAVKFVSEAKSYYRQCNQNSLSRQISDKSLKSIFLSTTLCINYLLSLEDSERTRAACLRLLKSRHCYFYRAKHEIIKSAEKLASDLGGTLIPPAMSRGFRVVSYIAGWEMATKIKDKLWTIEIFCRKNCDRLLDMMFSLWAAIVARRR